MNSDRASMPQLTDRHHPFHYATALTLLMKLGVDIHNVSIRAVGEHRNYLGEILSQQPAAGQPLDTDTPVVLDVGMVSAVDFLPYQFFYGWHSGQARGDGWENDARHLMAPFDGSVARYNAVATHEKLEYSLALVNLDYLLRFLKLFEFVLPEAPDSVREPLLWSAIMPGFHMWAGSPQFVAGVLRYLFGYTFDFEENVAARYDIPEGIRCRLGEDSSRLGEDLIIGRSFSECDSSYQLTISGVPADEASELLPGKPQRRKLEWILSICMPTNLDCIVRIKVAGGDLELGSSKAGSLLGYSAFVTKDRHPTQLRA
ncbi:MAG: type VI secretion system baseplate subunit TssG [candidate division Zixibacteria bacterium]|nr:type VI secretion system baseplate subunit TssG [candidate division Zixibacteria bacterium]MDH3939167.1 type VI secretion system baseplate subunit TssG [candidate division Zixibacteria bacterium]